MTILVAGATGATGSLLVRELLNRGHNVRAIVRSTDKLTKLLGNQPGLTQIEASILDLTDEQMASHLVGCEGVASCLGHNISLKGLYGEPRKLVTDSVRRLCQAIGANQGKEPVKFVLMNTTGNRNADLSEPISIAQKAVIALLRLMLPPHVDNEHAADYLRVNIGQAHPGVEWVVVRPDGLIDNPEESKYELHPSPTRSALFNAGQTSRINVAHFMAKLLSEENAWSHWKGQMPVIYNSEISS